MQARVHYGTRCAARYRDRATPCDRGRRGGAWTALILFLAAPAILSAGTALADAELRNSSFEEPVDSGMGYNWVSDRAVYWERWGGWFNRETSWSPVLDGQCIVAYHHWRIQGDDTSGIYQDIPALPSGQVYTFSIQAFRDKGANAEYVELRLEPFNGGDPIASEVYRMTDLKSGKWTTLSISGRTSSAGIRVLVIAKPGRSSQRRGALKFDRASFLAGGDSNAPPHNDPWRGAAYGTTRRR